MTAAQLRRWHPDTVRLVPRMERAASRLAPLGPRVVLELLVEIGCAHDCLPDVAKRLGRYAELDSGMIHAIEANRIAPRRLMLVSSE